MDMGDLEAKLKEATEAGARIKLIATDGGCHSMYCDIHGLSGAGLQLQQGACRSFAVFEVV
jgi:hypothetical protein